MEAALIPISPSEASQDGCLIPAQGRDIGLAG